jgi:hypothetical protein
VPASAPPAPPPPLLEDELVALEVAPVALASLGQGPQTPIPQGQPYDEAANPWVELDTWTSPPCEPVLGCAPPWPP